LQGIVFGADDVSLFGSAGQQARFEQHLDRVAALAGLLGARACVFGAPRQRDPGELGADEAWRRALGGLRRIAPAFAAVGSALAFEAVPAAYGNRFITTTADAVRLVGEAATPGIKLQIDTGTLFAAAEDPAVLVAAGPLAVHMHASEPELAPVGRSGRDHLPVAAALVDSGYEGSISIEMRPVADWATAITDAVAFVRDLYF
jgi:sugar phosphate isomerase/epimerase